MKLCISSIVLFLALLNFAQKSTALRKTSFFERFLIDSFAPLQQGISFAQRKTVSFVERYLTNLSARRENILFKRQIKDLKSELFTAQEMIKENQRLKRLLGFVKDIPSHKVLAQVVAWDAASDFKVLRINKGLNDGIKLQSTVVTSEGLVGHIYRLTNNFADVLTILDSNSRVDGIVGRTRSHGIVEGHSLDRCIIKYVTRTDPVILRDEVVTSGLGNIYPKGLKIGDVTKIEREIYGITQYIEITPSVNFQKLEEVVVLVSGEDELEKREKEILDEGGH